MRQQMSLDKKSQLKGILCFCLKLEDNSKEEILAAKEVKNLLVPDVSTSFEIVDIDKDSLVYHLIYIDYNKVFCTHIF